MQLGVDAGMLVDEVDPREPVQILVERDLEDGRAALARSDDRRSEEVEPDLQAMGVGINTRARFVDGGEREQERETMRN